jgi:hypothetical protein
MIGSFNWGQKRLLRSQLKLATKEMHERSKELFERMLAIAS